MAGKAASEGGGGAEKGTRGQQDGGTVPYVHPNFHSELTVPLSFCGPLLRNISFLSGYRSFYSHPGLERIFFFLKRTRPGGVAGWR